MQLHFYKLAYLDILQAKNNTYLLKQNTYECKIVQTSTRKNMPDDKNVIVSYMEKFINRLALAWCEAAKAFSY